MIPTMRLTQRFGDWAVIYGKDAAGDAEQLECIMTGTSVINKINEIEDFFSLRFEQLEACQFVH